MPGLRASPGYWIVMGVSMLALCPPLLVAVAALSGNGHRWVDFLAQFTSPALVGTAVVFIVLLGLRLWPGAILGGGVMALLFVAVQPQWSPPRGQAQPGAAVLTLYSANTHLNNTDAGAIAASVRAARPDIIILIEVAPSAAARLGERLAPYPFMRVQYGRRAQARDTIVIASRWPLSPLVEAKDGVSAVATVAQTPLGPIRLVATHLTRPWPDQFQWGQINQATALARFVAGLDPHPTVIAGDFNSVSSARIGRQIQARMGVIAAPGWPGTWPGSLPTGLGVTIDQVYRTPDLALLDRRVGLHNGSDHWPVVTRLTLAN